MTSKLDLRFIIKGIVPAVVVALTVVIVALAFVGVELPPWMCYAMGAGIALKLLLLALAIVTIWPERKPNDAEQESGPADEARRMTGGGSESVAPAEGWARGVK